MILETIYKKFIKRFLNHQLHL